MTDHYYTSETENVGQFRCETTFIPSNVTFATDLLASFKGRAEFPSPGVLLGSTLASCMMSLVSVVAARKGVDLKGMRVLARAAESSKGIEKIELKAIMPPAKSGNEESEGPTTAPSATAERTEGSPAPSAETLHPETAPHLEEPPADPPLEQGSLFDS